METSDLARAATEVDRVPVARRQRLLSHDGPWHIAEQLALIVEDCNQSIEFLNPATPAESTRLAPLGGGDG